MTFNKNKQRPTYLHFLDRELRRAENVTYSDDMILAGIIVAVINSLSYCYCSASILLESNAVFPKSTNLLLELEKFGLVKLLTNENSFEEFISSRQQIYSRSSDRYPMYFRDDSRKFWPTNPLMVNSSTTNELKSNIFNWLGKSDSTSQIDKSVFLNKDLKNFENKIFKEKGRAITLDLFLSDEQLANDKQRRDSGRLVSYFYTKRYLDLYKGELLCNLPQLQFYDRLSTIRWINDYHILFSVLDCFNVPNIFFQKGRFIPHAFISFVCHPMFKHIQVELISIMTGLSELTSSDFENDINRTLAFFKSNFNRTLLTGSTNNNPFIESLYFYLTSSSLNLSMNNESFNTTYHMTKKSITSTNKVLIVTATPTEAKSFLQAMEKKGKSQAPNSFRQLTFWNFGIVGNSDLKMIKLGDMGSNKPSGSALVINDAIDIINPDYVIMVGIAFGLKPDKQKIGQILVAKELENYESAKVTDDGSIQRGLKIPAGATLLNKFDNAALSYNKADVEIGFIVSGDKLVDSKPFVEGLKKMFPEAIGGEMEGTGLQSSCNRKNKEWILIKGICDWGYDKQHINKDSDQQMAIDNVCDYLIYTLSEFDL
jgi:nucleoside phosphorylase